MIEDTRSFRRILEDLMNQLKQAEAAKDVAKISELNNKILDIASQQPQLVEQMDTTKIDPELKKKLDETNQRIQQEKGKKVYFEKEKKPSRFYSKEEARRKEVNKAKGIDREGKISPEGKRANRIMKATKSGPYSQPVFMGQEKNIHPPGSPVSKYIMRQRLKNKMLGKLAAAASMAGGVAARVAIPLAVAQEALSSDDINVGEDYEIEQMKNEIDKENILKDRLLGDEERVKEFKRKEQDLLRKPVRAVDLLENKEPVIQNRTVIPDLALTEEEEPETEIASTEEDMNYENFLKKMKSKLGYS
jgi:hypothetical protein